MEPGGFQLPLHSKVGSDAVLLLPLESPGDGFDLLCVLSGCAQMLCLWLSVWT